MKIIIIFFAFILSITLVSCDYNNPVDPNGITSQVNSITGKLKNWNLGNNKSVIFIGAGDIWNSDKIYSVSQIDKNGNFELSNLGSPSEIMFMNPVYPRFSENTKLLQNSLVSSDSTARKVWGNFIITLTEDTSFYTKGHIYRRNFNDWFYLNPDSVKSGDFYVEYIYVDKDVRLAGIAEYKFTDVNFKIKGHFTLEYNVNLKKGWNKQITFIKSQEVTRDSGFTQIVATRSIFNYEPYGGYWDYNYYQ